MHSCLNVPIDYIIVLSSYNDFFTITVQTLEVKAVLQELCYLPTCAYPVA